MAQEEARVRARAQFGSAPLLRGVAVLVAVMLGWALAAYPGILWKLTLMRETSVISTDDAMRLVQVRDLIAGQGWFDLTQRRLGLEGVEMHWSRLVDVPLAAMILVLRPFLDAGMAETATAWAWPLLLLLPSLAATAAAGRALAGSAGMWVATLLMGFELESSARFVPGQIDHHSLQLTLLVVAVSLAAIAGRSPRAALGAGAAIAASVAVGVELVPVYAVFFACAALDWSATGAGARDVLRALALGFAGTLVVLFLATAPASAWRGGYCDALSLDLLLPALTGTLGLAAAATWLSDGPAWVRVGALAVVAAAALGLAAGVAPACLQDPLAEIDPFLREHWLDRVAEAKGWATLLAQTPATEFPTLAATLAALAAAALLALRPGPERWLWATIGGTLLLSLALAFWQHRVAMVLEPLCVLPIATLAVRLFRGDRDKPPGLRRLVAVTLVFAAIPATWAPLLERLPSPATPQVRQPGLQSALGTWACYREGAMTPLAELPPGLVSASSNLGPHILLAGPHRVLSAPYHRNTRGMTAQLRIALADDAGAEAMLRQLGVDYVVACLHDSEYSTGEGFFSRLQSGIVPAFLEPLARTDEGIAIYRLRPAI